MKELPTMQELQSFITYNKTGSFIMHKSMNITQSAFSAQMKKLERLVGVKLISRSTRGSRLTQKVNYSYQKQNKFSTHWNVLFNRFV